MATLCSTACSTAVTLAEYRDECDAIRTVSGGIGYVGVIKCGTALDMTSAVDIAAARTAGTLAITPAGIGSKPLPTATKAKYTCGPEKTTAYSHEINFKSFDVDDEDSQAFWNDIITKNDALRLFYITCNGELVYDTTALTTVNPGFVYGVDGGEVIPENDQTENISFEIKATIKTAPDTAILVRTPMSAAIRTALLG